MPRAKFTKLYIEKCLADLLRELEACPPWLLAEIVDGMMATGLSYDEAIRKLAEVETTTKRLLEASRSIGEA